ncbi:TlpA family protein disulfide reductase [Myroides odoratimimus]|uniref:TlpA family protein disulfide reductase n=1 Tax=Myroides odoratimimus TaxID=76832 RepID=UPI0038D38E5A
MKYKIFYMLLMLCSIGVLGQEKLHITGKLEGISNEVKMKLSSGGQEQEFSLKNGKVDVSMVLEDVPNYVRLDAYVGKETKTTFFFLGNESVTIHGSINDFSGNLRAINSVNDSLRYENMLVNKQLVEERSVYIKEYYRLLEEGKDKDSVAKVYLSDEEPLGKIKKLSNLINKQNNAFIKKNINTAYARYLLQHQARDYSFDYLNELYALIDPKYYDTKEVQMLKIFIDHKPLEVGAKYYDFYAEDMQTKQVKLSDYFKGKYVLLDFSTYHCGYCEKAAPKTAQIADNLKDKLVHITYYAGHDQKDKFKYYSEFKGNKGILLGNKEGRLSPVLAMYRNNSTPDYWLFNLEGKLVMRFEGMQGEDFEEQLRALMK